jgi:hypothetical protein
MIVPGPLTFNVREWTVPHVPKLEVGELAGHCVATRHRIRLWLKAAPRIGGDVFLKLFTHGAPEKNAIPLLEQDGLHRTFEYLTEETRKSGAHIHFVSAYQMWIAIDAIRRRVDPMRALYGPAHESASAMAACAS